MIRRTIALQLVIAGAALSEEAAVHFPAPSPATPIAAEVKDWPASVDEAVNRILSEMPDDVKLTIRSMPESDLRKLHHSIGRKIRNRFGLWSGNTDLLKDSGASEPDAASMVIIQSLWKRLNEN